MTTIATLQRGDHIHVITGRYAGLHGEILCLHRESVTLLCGDHRAYVLPVYHVAPLPQAAPQPEPHHAPL